MKMTSNLDMAASSSSVAEGADLEQFRNELIEKLLAQHQGVMASGSISECTAKCYTGGCGHSGLMV